MFRNSNTRTINSSIDIELLFLRNSLRRKKDSYIQKTAGFTLIELMIVMGMLGVISSLAVPSLAWYLSHYKLQSTAREIASVMHMARFKAISDRSKYGIFFDERLNSYMLFKNTDDNELLNDEDIIERDVRYLSNRIKIKTNFSNDTVVFRENGTAKGGSVYIQGNSNDNYRIKVLFTTGRIQLVRG